MPATPSAPALIAAANSYMGRLVVVVDDDVDPSNLNDVMWAITTRCEPSEQIDIVRSAWSSALDPRIHARSARARRHLAFEADHRRLPAFRLDDYPPTSALTPKRRGRSEEKWFR